VSLPTVGVIAVCHTYAHFAADWARSVRGLTTKPDKVVIAATDPVAVVDAIAGRIDATVIQAAEPFGYGRYLNQAVAACDTDWIVWAGIDDRYRPVALDGLRFTQADVVGFGLQYGTGTQAWRPAAVDPNSVLQVRSNLVPCGSPFRRWVWERIPFQPDLAPFEDWAFWVGAASLGARFATTGRIDVDYAIHPQQIVPPDEPTRSQIEAWARTLPRLERP
jgi:hypothetical protein